MIYLTLFLVGTVVILYFMIPVFEELVRHRSRANAVDSDVLATNDKHEIETFRPMAYCDANGGMATTATSWRGGSMRSLEKGAELEGFENEGGEWDETTRRIIPASGGGALQGDVPSPLPPGGLRPYRGTARPPYPLARLGGGGMGEPRFPQAESEGFRSGGVFRRKKSQDRNMSDEEKLKKEFERMIVKQARSGRRRKLFRRWEKKGYTNLANALISLMFAQGFAATRVHKDTYFTMSGSHNGEPFIVPVIMQYIPRIIRRGRRDPLLPTIIYVGADLKGDKIYLVEKTSRGTNNYVGAGGADKLKEITAWFEQWDSESGVDKPERGLSWLEGIPEANFQLHKKVLWSYYSAIWDSLFDGREVLELEGVKINGKPVDKIYKVNSCIESDTIMGYDLKCFQNEFQKRGGTPRGTMFPSKPERVMDLIRSSDALPDSSADTKHFEQVSMADYTKAVDALRANADAAKKDLEMGSPTVLASPPPPVVEGFAERDLRTINPVVLAQRGVSGKDAIMQLYGSLDSIVKTPDPVIVVTPDGSARPVPFEKVERGAVVTRTPQVGGGGGESGAPAPTPAAATTEAFSPLRERFQGATATYIESGLSVELQKGQTYTIRCRIAHPADAAQVRLVVPDPQQVHFEVYMTRADMAGSDLVMENVPSRLRLHNNIQFGDPTILPGQEAPVKSEFLPLSKSHTTVQHELEIRVFEVHHDTRLSFQRVMKNAAGKFVGEDGGEGSGMPVEISPEHITHVQDDAGGEGDGNSGGTISALESFVSMSGVRRLLGLKRA
jgi:hypothetical protein